MSIHVRGGTTSDANRTEAEAGFLGVLHAAARIAVLLGAVGSVALTLCAGRHNPHHLLTAMFVVWVLSPFVALLLADVMSKRWPVITRGALYGVMLAVTLGSLAIYIHDVLRPRKAQAAFVYVAVPPASWALTAVVIPVAALIARSRSPRKNGG